jgi:hypothetical protein
MLIVLALILGLAWFIGIGVDHVASAGFHLLLLLAIAAVVLYFVQRARRQRVT